MRLPQGVVCCIHRLEPLEDTMRLTEETRSFPRVDAVIEMICDWLQHRREIAEICKCDSQEMGRIAHELGVSTAEIDDLVRRGPHAADELPKILNALQLDPAAIARTQGLVMQDMTRVCAHCSHKQRCNEELAQGTAAHKFEDYCGNASTIKGLSAAH
jgi:hypothetical protein